MKEETWGKVIFIESINILNTILISSLVSVIILSRYDKVHSFKNLLSIPEECEIHAIGADNLSSKNPDRIPKYLIQDCPK